MPKIPNPPKSKSTPKSTSTKAPSSSRDKFIWAISQQESGGSYSAVNRSSGALGKYQVMPEHLAGGSEWAGRVFGHAITQQQFLSSPALQEQMVSTILGGYYDRYGAAGAAAMWYSGQPDPTKTYGSPPVYKYVNSVLAIMRGAPANAGANLPAGSSSSSTNATDAGYSTSKPPDCLVGFSIGVGYVCVLTKGQARAVLGALLLGAGGIVGGAGLIILASYGLRKSGALDAAASAAATIPGAGRLAGKVAAGADATRRTPQQAAEKARARKAARAAKKQPPKEETKKEPPKPSKTESESGSGKESGES